MPNFIVVPSVSGLAYRFNTDKIIRYYPVIKDPIHSGPANYTRVVFEDEDILCAVSMAEFDRLVGLIPAPELTPMPESTEHKHDYVEVPESELISVYWICSKEGCRHVSWKNPN